MNSTNHSSISSTSDVAILPPINNHSLKRSRSPSLNHQDDRNDETPTKKNRKRRTTTDIDPDLGY